jgi:SAM-dependent methyltransferase
VSSDPVFADAQRLVFGSVAELYDRARPPYPEAAIEMLIAQTGLARGDEVVEVGAGTGKVTRPLARRGLRVVAIEPSAEMAAVGESRCRGLHDVSFVRTEFESWTPPRSFRALVCANAWHWIDPAARYRLAFAALEPAATLACLWMLPDWSGCALRDDLRAVYRALVPELEPRFPMHPASDPAQLAGDWGAEIAGTAGRFGDPRIEWFASSPRFSARSYVEVLGTHQDHILLSPKRRDALTAAIAAAIDAAGGTLVLPTMTRLCLATRSE